MTAPCPPPISDLKHEPRGLSRLWVAVISTVAAFLLVPAALLAFLSLSGVTISRSVYLGLVVMVLPLGTFFGVGVAKIGRLSIWAAAATCSIATLASAVAVFYYFLQ